MKEEDEIRKKCGTENPFTVPEGYFDNLTKEIMDKLPEKELILQKKVAMFAKIKPWFYAAAIFTGVLLSIHYTVYKTEKQTSYANSVKMNNEALPDEYIEVMMDRSMMDDYTLYQYLTDANIETVYE